MAIKKQTIDLQWRLENQIFSGNWKQDTLFDIKDLASKYHTTVKEINEVIPILLRKGLVRNDVNGTIRIQKIPQAHIESVFQYADKLHLKPRSIVRSVEIIPADDFIAEKLALKKDCDVFVQVRTRLINDEVIANQYNYIPYEICPGLEEVDLSTTSFQVTLENKFHTVITRIQELYALEYPKRDDLQILGLLPDSKILAVQRTSYSQNDYPLVFADIHVNLQKFQYVAALWPKAGELLKSKNEA